ncbi:SCO2322 family protein [Angustibacter luteus]|uniref:SCO2322 family protein n=1 Tax=Angustibacter luteus TaxID=658456 RepID=A0ABW1JAX8_9ACTN
MNAHPRTTLLRALRLMAVLVVAAVAGLVVASPAHADAYRYWGYYQLKDGAWTFAQKGPAETTPADGAVEGWRFAVADESSTRTPRLVPTFDSLCGTTDKTAGNKLVALVVDFGRPADGPDGTSAPPAPIAQCVSVPTAATGSDVMAAAGLTLRLDKSLTCAINGWPATGCGDPVDPVPAAAASPDTSITLPAAEPTSASSSTASDDDGGIPTAAWVGIGVAVVGGAVLALLAMRRGSELKD